MPLIDKMLLIASGFGFLCMLTGLYGQRMPVKYRSLRTDKIFGILSAAGAFLFIIGLAAYKYHA